MCHSIEIDTDKKLIHITASKNVDAFELKEILAEIINHEEWQPGFNILCDYREIEKFNVNFKDIVDLTDWQISVDARLGNGRCAIVASRDLVYGMSRMWEILSAERSLKIGVFRNMDDAVSWLGYSTLASCV